MTKLVQTFVVVVKNPGKSLGIFSLLCDPEWHDVDTLTGPEVPKGKTEISMEDLFKD